MLLPITIKFNVQSYRLLSALALIGLLAFASCKKKDDSPATDTSKKYVLVIENGAQSVKAGKKIQYNAYLIDNTGAKVNTSGTVSYTLANGDTSASFSGNILSVKSTATSSGVVTASVTQDGVTYTASAPVNYVGSNDQSSAFTVAPEAVLWTTGAGDIPLWPVYLGKGAATFTYLSSNPSVVTVNSAGSISFISAGSANITVTLNVDGKKQDDFTVPVLVVGQPAVALPVTRISIDKKAFTLFKGDTKSFTATAYNSDGKDVTSTVTFTWKFVPKDTTADDTPAFSITSNGATATVKGDNFGDAYLIVTASGLTDQAEVNVINDKFIFANPFFVSLGGTTIDPVTFQPVTNPDSATITATKFSIDHTKFYANNNDPAAISEAVATGSYKWYLPLSGNAQLDAFLDILSISPFGAQTSKAILTAKQGKMGNNVVKVGLPSEPDTDPGVVAVTAGL